MYKVQTKRKAIMDIKKETNITTELKREGEKRSCLHYAFIDAGFMFGKNVKEEFLYSEYPPHKYKNTSLNKITNV